MSTAIYRKYSLHAEDTYPSAFLWHKHSFSLKYISAVSLHCIETHGQDVSSLAVQAIERVIIHPGEEAYWMFLLKTCMLYGLNHGTDLVLHYFYVLYLFLPLLLDWIVFPYMVYQVIFWLVVYAFKKIKVTQNWQGIIFYLHLLQMLQRGLGGMFHHITFYTYIFP